MKYAFWNLNADNPEYLTGPEETIFNAGGLAEGGWAAGDPDTRATILGYITKDFSPVDLSAWNYEETSQENALNFCLAINPNAYLLPNGRITYPLEV